MTTEGLPYTPLAAAEDEVGEEEGSQPPGPKRGVALSINDKWRLVKPMLPKYMLPLCKSRYIVQRRFSLLIFSLILSLCIPCRCLVI